MLRDRAADIATGDDVALDPQLGQRVGDQVGHVERRHAGGSVGRAWVAEPARHDDVEVREQRQHLVEPEERVGPAVQENHGRPV
ncbi:MAG TPA: hypothetical protein VIG79_19090, partial [Lapillicoccus sp.]